MIKSEADLSDELVAGRYILNTNMLYEINGTINLSHSIEINNAYIIGQDSGEDKLIRMNGSLFTGATGGYIRTVTLVSQKVFDFGWKCQ